MKGLLTSLNDCWLDSFDTVKLFNILLLQITMVPNTAQLPHSRTVLCVIIASHVVCMHLPV